MTNLGPPGNEHVAQTFARYRQKPAGCLATRPGKRVLITGFGLFSGASFNISGVTISSMASPSFMPNAIDLAAHPTTFSSHAQTQPALSFMRATDHGGRTVVRSLTINGEAYEVCFLLLDVLWDLAAAIIVLEMERFQPELVIMTGRGSDASAIFEGGATNRASLTSGYDFSGKSAGFLNQPQEPYVLPPHTAALHATVAMPWNNHLLRERSQGLIEALGFTALAATEARSSNEYICNNISYVVIQASKGIPIELAGGAIQLAPTISSHPQIGFLHLPLQASMTKISVSTWAQVLLTSIDASLQAAPE